MTLHGNVYFCESGNAIIRMVNSSGIITTTAGTGFIGYSGDGGPATAANLYDPYSIAVDNIGDIYFSDASSNCIRKINTSGIITTIAGGNPTLGYSGDGGPATAADFRIPIGVAADAAGNVYVADASNNRVRKINASGIITTYAGTGIEGYSGDGGQATLAELSGPVGVTVDASGNLYIADYGIGNIRLIKNTESVHTVNTIEDNITVYPNPAIMALNFQFPPSGDATIKLMDVTGRLMGEQVVSNITNTSFDVSGYTPGIYMYQVITNGKTQTGKILIGKQ